MAIIGCGVIGGGWVARSALAGRSVRWVDPAANAADRLDAALERAERAWAALGLGPVDGHLNGQTSPVASVSRCSSIAEAVDGAAVVIEALPERLELKAAAYVEVEAAAPADALLVSSTSGLRPTALQATLNHPERLVVGHPFNPVYLLPLVEVVGGEQTAHAAIERAMSFFRSLYMEPLHVRVEIDAFIADRLLEAVWREALWLVNDGVATTGEID
ncbi:MAG: 3-hydroxyacyl-CoA dehydrogenase NAD-binding domain-containing protein, partial [Acidimicrobiales bacterium]